MQPKISFTDKILLSCYSKVYISQTYNTSNMGEERGIFSLRSHPTHNSESSNEKISSHLHF